MGTNYYWYQYTLPHNAGKLPYEAKHIGKKSYGWVFALHVYPAEGIVGLASWKERWQRGVIKDEYNQVVTLEEIEGIITQLTPLPKPLPPDTWYRENKAVPGPHGHARRNPEERKDFPLTWEQDWDLCDYDFA